MLGHQGSMPTSIAAQPFGANAEATLTEKSPQPRPMIPFSWITVELRRQEIEAAEGLELINELGFEEVAHD